MSRIFFILVSLVAIVFAVLIFAPGIVPTAAFKPRIEAAASNALGREVTIGDNLSFRLLPRAAFHVEELTIANADGFDGPPLARVGEADIGVNLFKLLSNTVDVDRFVLTAPDLNLVRAADGRVNWNLAQAGATDTETDNGGRAARDLNLGTVRIVDGKARFRDDAAKQTYAASDIDLNILLKSLREPLEVDGTMVFQDQPAKLDLVLTTLADLTAGAPSNLKIDMTIGDSAAGADLTIEPGETLRYRGPIRLNAPDLPAFAALTGVALADAPGFDRLSLNGDIDGGESALRLSGATVNFDDIAANGALTLDWSGPRPKVGGVLSTDQLDLRPYMPPPATAPEGFPQWSEAKMDFTSLRNVDADLDISTNAIFLNDLKTGETRLKLRLDDGRMTADIPELAMYGGQGSGRIVVNARGGAPSFSGNLDMNAVNAQRFSADLLRHDNLLGLGSFKFDFTATGSSQAEIMRTLDGRGGFDIANGALKGVNIAKIARAAAQFQEGFNPAALASAVAAARGANEETDFSEFLSNFSVDNGLIEAPTITLNGPYLTMTGVGAIDLPAQTINLRLSPRVTTTADGQAGRAIAVPVKVGGTFAKPTIGIDAEALVRRGAETTLRDLIGGLGNKDGAGDDENADAPAEKATPEDTARRALEGIFGKPKEPPAEEQLTEENPSPQKSSTEETIVKDALGAIFGARKKPAEEPKEEDPESE